MRIKFLGPIQRPPSEVVEKVEAEFQGGTMRELLTSLGFPEKQVWFLSVIANEERLAPDEKVAADDEVTIMLLVGGG
jgi:sulfur carrier protein ThiS